MSRQYNQEQTSEKNELTIGDSGSIDPGGEFQGTTLSLLENMPRMQRSINDVPKSTPMARFSTAPTHARTRVPDPYERRLKQGTD